MAVTAAKSTPVRGGVALFLLLALSVGGGASPTPASLSSSSSSSLSSAPSQLSRRQNAAAAGAAGASDGASGSRRAPSDAASANPQNTSRRAPGSTARGHGGSDIVFPDSQYRPRFSGHRPNCVREGSTYCEEGVDGYPSSIYLSQVLENSIGFREYFGNDSLGQNLVDRFGPDGETTICQSREQLIFPKMGQNAEGQWVFIVNLDKTFQQGIRVELCQNPDRPCTFANVLPSGVNAVCRQKYIYRRLLGVGNEGDAQPDSFRMPSCCACYINSEVTSRILLQPNGRSTTKRRRRSLDMTQR